jgi:hypothetical protein
MKPILIGRRVEFITDNQRIDFITPDRVMVYTINRQGEKWYIHVKVTEDITLRLDPLTGFDSYHEATKGVGVLFRMIGYGLAEIPSTTPIMGRRLEP